MAVIAGFFAQQTVSGYDRLYITPDLDDYAPDWINDLVYWESTPSPGAQTLTANYPVSTTPYVKDGWIARSYFDDFYNRIHITPHILNIGNLLSVQTRDATVWNAYLTPQLLSAISEANTQGLTESGIVAPITFPPLKEMTYSVTVDTHGPAVVDAVYTFDFPLETPTLTVIGRRLVVFPFQVDWSDPPVESYQWLTDVEESAGRIEQRIGLRGVPRRGLSFTVATTDKRQSALLETMLLGWQQRGFAVPIWTDAQRLAAPLAAGSWSVPCLTAGYEFQIDDLVILWTDYAHYESLQIAAVNPGSIGFSSATLAAWPAGARLLPVRTGNLSRSEKVTRETDHYVSKRCDFAFSDHPGWPAADVGATYGGYRVYPLKPDWASEISATYDRLLQELDYQTGTPWDADPSGLAAIIKQWNWTFQSRAEVVAFRAWLAARDGRRVPFWSETQGADMTLAATVGGSATALQIANIGYARFINGRADRCHLLLRTWAGAEYYRQILSAAEDSADLETLAIDSAFGVSIAPADVRDLKFLQLTRLEADEMSITWHHGEAAEAAGAMRSVVA